MAQIQRKQDTDRLELEQKLLAVEQFQLELIQSGEVPETGELLLRRLKEPLQYLGGLILALFVSILAILMNFILFNMILHI